MGFLAEGDFCSGGVRVGWVGEVEVFLGGGDVMFCVVFKGFFGLMGFLGVEGDELFVFLEEGFGFFFWVLGVEAVV